MRAHALLAPALSLFLGAAASARAQGPSVIVGDAGPGVVGRRLARALAGPHILFPPGPSSARLPADSAYRATVVVLGRQAIIEGTVDGDVIVVGGDAFVHPGARVEGRVEAIGGGAYGSMLASVRDSLVSHRDFTFDIRATPSGYRLDYRPLRVGAPSRVTLPGIYGVRLPTYDRSDGLSLPFGPLVSVDTGAIELDPWITYRSNLGAVDPSLGARLTPNRRLYLTARAGRETLTNDSWIWSDPINSAAVLALGTDERNYYRADRGEIDISRLFETPAVELEPMFGVRLERAWSLGPWPNATGGPWSVFGRRSKEHMLRPNPSVSTATIHSMVAGATLAWESQGVRATVAIQSEGGVVSAPSSHFLQTTFDGDIRFPTFGSQLFSLDAHVVQTGGGPAPPQRWSYLGGSGTIKTLPLLSMGGDQLVYLESNYLIPLQGFTVPIVGAPSVTLRHIIGSAGVRSLPDLEQNLGLRLALSFLRLDLITDPARRRTTAGFGLSVSR